MASEQTFSDWYFAYCQANNCTPSMEEVWRAALATQPAESKACASVGVEPDDEPDAADEWRRLALQFDGHRMQALALIRQCIAKLAPHGLYDDLRESLITFNAAPPLSGEKVLAERIAALASPATSVGEPEIWMKKVSAGVSRIDHSFVGVWEWKECDDEDPDAVAFGIIATPPAAPAATEAPSDERWWSPPDTFGQNWLTNGVALHPNTAGLVVRFARALAQKLAAAEVKYGYSDGWRSPEWMDECRAKLLEHVAKGDPRDVAAYCAFLWHHNASTATLFGASSSLPDDHDVLEYCDTHPGSTFASAVFALATPAPAVGAMKEEISRIHHVLKKHGKHPGRTDDRLSDLIDQALAAVPPSVQPVLASLSDAKDGPRYRWLRDRLSGRELRDAGLIYSTGHEGIDVAIDAALASSTPTQPPGAATPKESA